jgi:hypothetical protein
VAIEEDFGRGEELEHWDDGCDLQARRLCSARSRCRGTLLHQQAAQACAYS